MLNGIYIIEKELFNYVYGHHQRKAIAKYVHIDDVAYCSKDIEENPGLLAGVDVVFGSWGLPVLDQRFLDMVPELKVVFYGAGSTRYFTTDAFWDADILLTSAWVANAIPVAEYTVSQIIFSLKCGWSYVRQMKKNRIVPTEIMIPGTYKSTIGLISFGMIPRYIAKLLESYDLNVIVYDPYIDPELPATYGASLCTLDEIFSFSNVVCLHMPGNEETEGVITAEHFKKMRPYSTFINTARGSIVREQEMIDVLREREDITAILDVTCPEPPMIDSPLYEMDNVVITPHISGSMRHEMGRLGQYMVDELYRYVDGDQLKWVLNSEKVALLA